MVVSFRMLQPADESSMVSWDISLKLVERSPLPPLSPGSYFEDDNNWAIHFCHKVTKLYSGKNRSLLRSVWGWCRLRHRKFIEYPFESLANTRKLVPRHRSHPAFRGFMQLSVTRAHCSPNLFLYHHTAEGWRIPLPKSRR